MSIFSLRKVSNTKAKLIADNHDCISKAKKRFKFDYLLVLEDDAELIYESQLNKITNYLLPNLMDRHPEIVQFKLYRSLIWQGFGLDFKPLVELLLTPFLIIVMCYLSVLKWMHIRVIQPKTFFYPKHVRCVILFNFEKFKKEGPQKN